MKSETMKFSNPGRLANLFLFRSNVALFNLFNCANPNPNLSIVVISLVSNCKFKVSNV